MEKLNIDGGTAAVLAPVEVRDRIPRETPRWLFFAGDFPKSKRKSFPAGGVDFGSRCIIPPRGKSGFMNRCLVTPLVEVELPMFKQEVPSGAKMREVLPGRDEFGRPSDVVHMSLYPGEEYAVLMRGYDHWGLQEITALRGMKPADALPLKINSLFFPNWPELPETNKELIDYIANRKTFFQKSEHKDLYWAVADQMIEGVRKVDTWMRNHIDAVHSCFLLPENDESFRTNYNPVDLHFIHRAKLQRRDQDLATMADTQAMLTQVLTGNANKGAMSQEDFLQSLQLILSENTSAIKEAIARQQYPIERPE